MDETPLGLIRSFEQYLSTILAAIDIDDQPLAIRSAILLMKRQVVDARLDIRDYEYADTRAEQERHARTAKKQLAQLEENIVSSTQLSIFSSVDIAQLSAQIQLISSQL